MYKSILRPILFLFPPEMIHNLAILFIQLVNKIAILNKLVKKIYCKDDPRLSRELFGIKFTNPVGLGAGFDKDAVMLDGLSNFGFGFIEVGTVTPEPQVGNPEPRLFRIPGSKALINRMGFNNMGVDKMVSRLRKRKSNVIVGGNIGKNKTTPNEKAANDYLKCLKSLYDFVDYFVVNVSSPNTPGLRELQEKEPLKRILRTLQQEIDKHTKKKPLLLKIAPDLSTNQLDDIIEIVNVLKLDGVVATNTTILRNDLNISADKLSRIGAGGLSGKPLEQRSNEVIRYLKNNLSGQIPIIGVGGIMNEEDVIKKMEAGASLVQLYTGFIYEGPGIVKRINKSLIKGSSV